MSPPRTEGAAKKEGKAFRLRESCNPFQTCSAFGKQRWEASTDTIMA